MPKIGIIGANGQVGAEVALHLASFPEVSLTCFVRSDYSAVLLRRFGIDCRTCDFDSARELSSYLDGLDLVADFSYPAGPTPELIDRIRRHVSSVMSKMQPGARFAYMSSLMAFGMPTGATQIRHYRFARTTYAAIKRASERVVLKSAKQRGIVPYCIRVGEVHGRLQAVSQHLRHRLTRNQVCIGNRSDDLSITVFASSIAHAVIRCAAGLEKPGITSLVSAPQWTLSQLYAYYSDELDSPADYRFLPINRRSIRRRMAARASRSLTDWRPFIELLLLMRSPWLFNRFKGAYRRSRPAAHGEPVWPTAQKSVHIVGAVPQPTFTDIQSSVDVVRAADRLLCQRLGSVLAGLRPTEAHGRLYC